MAIKNRFTERALQVLKALEQRPAVTLRSVLQEIYFCQGSLGSNFLRSQGLKRADIEAIREPQTDQSRITFQELISQAANVAAQFGHSLIGTQHLLYGLLRQAGSDRSLRRFFSEFALPIPRMMRTLRAVLATDSRFPNFEDLDPSSLPLQEISSQLEDELKSFEDNFETMHDHQKEYTPIGPQIKESLRSRTTSRIWEQFGIDLTQEARKGSLDPLIGREQELERVIQILGRRTKSNPVLIGEAGVGKTAIVQGLAQKIVSEEVPQSLLGKKIYDLRLGQLVAGTIFRGEFEARLETILKEAKKSQVILFIDEIHQVVGAGAASGSLDAAGILKPPLAKGEIQVIGATTLDEYRQSIEMDKALARRFQPVQIKEPSLKCSTEVLKGLKVHFEKYHGLKMTEPALQAAVELSQRYIPERRLPDKAIDVIDEAAVRVKSRLFPSAKQRLFQEWQKKLAELERAKTIEVDKGAYDRAFALKKEQKTLSAKLEALRKEIEKEESSRQILVTREDIKKVVARMTGVPVAQLTTSDRRRLDKLEQVLGREIIGQNEALRALATTIRRSRAGLSPESRPLGSFIFMGPTGVGKTETSKVLAREVFGPDALIKLDMSEFTEPHTVSRLIGAPAGYVGYGEGGELTEKVRRQPYSVVLFDEIEKAHPRVYNLLLQILEDGELTDSMGNEVDFRNAVVILTSNIGTRDFTKRATEIGFSQKGQTSRVQLKEDYQRIKQRSLRALQARMKPELLNRLDGIIVFNPLGKEAVKKIMRKNLERLQERLRQERKIALDWSPRALEFLANLAFNPKQGARPVRRVLQEKVENILAQKIIRNQAKTGSRLKLVLSGKNLALK